MPKGYLLAEFAVIEPAEFEKYRASIASVSGAFGGRYLVRRTEAKVLDGAWTPKRVVLIEFDSPERCQEFYDSPAYRAILPHRLASTEGHVLLLTGTEGD